MNAGPQQCRWYSDVSRYDKRKWKTKRRLRGYKMTKQRTRKSKLVYSFVKIDYCSVEMPLASAFPTLISVEIDKKKIGRSTMLAFIRVHSFAPPKFSRKYSYNELLFYNLVQMLHVCISTCMKFNRKIS